jgi:DNA invertase Pin-like site-specific DNA recombinase
MCSRVSCTILVSAIYSPPPFLNSPQSYNASMNTDVRKRVALYARVSTKQHGQDPETQLLPLREYLHSHRTFVLSDTFVDLGISGSKQRRPQLDRLMRDAKLRKFDVVLVARFDRFARSVTHLLTALEEFKSLGIDFISLNESIDTSTPMGKMVFTIIGAVAELERSLIRERVQAGVDRAKKEGKKLGRPRVLVDEEKVFDQIQAGESLGAVSRRWGIARETAKKIHRRWAVKNGVREPAISPLPD